jgi:hypothetical protein
VTLRYAGRGQSMFHALQKSYSTFDVIQGVGVDPIAAREVAQIHLAGRVGMASELSANLYKSDMPIFRG